MEIALIVCALYLSLGELVLSTNWDAEPKVFKSTIAQPRLRTQRPLSFLTYKDILTLIPFRLF